MITVKKQAEVMHARLNTIAANEQKLIDALGEALTRADQKLLDDVRSVTIEHETRRTHILSELHALASRIGAFAASTEPITIENDQQFDTSDAQHIAYDAADSEAPNIVATHMPEQNGSHIRPNRGGDWRKATKNICDDWGIAINGSEPVR